MSGGDDKVKETEDYRAIIEIAGNRYKNYQDIYVPAEDYAIDEAVNYDNTNRREQLSGQANAGVQSAFKTAIDKDIGEMTTQGVDPSSGKFNAAIDKNATASAEVATDNVNRTQTALQDDGVNARKNIVSLGNNQATQSLSGLNSVAINSSRDANNKAVRNYQEDANTSGAVGTAAGAAGRTALERFG